ncbi:MAG: AAA family ATPase [Chloroflexi bacterium]|nr:AAA family ATPase [Chloroflexota bacterium]
MPTGRTSNVFDSLNDREREILALLGEDLSDREIAARLHLSPTTVKWYNRQIFQKLGVENRKQAAERASALGLFEAPLDHDTPPHNLPTALTPFIGRIGDLETLSHWMSDPDSRLLTVAAPGGMGKSRLALAVAQHALRVFRDGVYFVTLAPVSAADSVLTHIIAAVRCPAMQDGRTPLQQLCDFLSNKHLMLVLDNFEHVLDAADSVVELLKAAPALKVLVTSRERLNLSAETVYPLGGLDFPEAAGDHEQREYGAMQLFVQSAQRADARFAAPPEEIARVCRLVQGMPLAIELAAAWVSVMTPAEIAAEIERSADVLYTDARDIPERMRSIRAVFESTWARLTEPERSAFAAMSVFRGGCTQEAALGDRRRPACYRVAGRQGAALARRADWPTEYP